MADAPGPHLTGLHQLIQGFHRFFNRRFIVEAGVDDIEVEIVRSPGASKFRQSRKDRLTGQAAVVEIDLGGGSLLVPGDILFSRPTYVFFTRSSRITIGRIEKIDAQREGVLHHGLSRRSSSVQCVHRTGLAETHTAYANFGNFNIRRA